MVVLRSSTTSSRRGPSRPVELLESRRLLAALVVTGTSADDAVVVRLSGTDVVATNGGAEVARAPLAGTDGIQINLGPGEDAATIESPLNLPATVTGGSGSDTITGGGGPDSITGGSEDDVIGGGGGDDVIESESGNDVVTGGAGNDYLVTGSGDDLVFGDGGKVGDAGEAGAGNDTIRTQSESDTVYGGGGDDEIHGGSEADVLYGDYESIAPGSPLAGDGNDTIDGGSENDTIVGDSGGAGAGPGFRHGDDTLRSAGGDGDVVYGDSGPAASQGRAGNDVLWAANRSSAILMGQDGDDTYRFFDPLVAFQGAVAEVRESASGGNDTLDLSNLRVADGATVEVSIDLGSQGPHHVTVNGGSRMILWIENPGSVENVRGTPFADRITGSALANRIDGGAGDDVLFGAAGNDVLVGGPGLDELRGGDGDDLFLSHDRQRDKIFGGAGNDTCPLPIRERDTLDLTPDNDVENMISNARRTPARRGVLR